MTSTVNTRRSHGWSRTSRTASPSSCSRGTMTPIAPEAEDHLIIDEIPDIFATGHVHAAGVDQYRGVVLVNSSTWQAQTPYQKMRNIEPMPARLPIVDLASGQAIVREF